MPSVAHPRACGENLTTSELTVMTAGSSPRMRGKRYPDRRSAIGLGLIPAHAGKTRNPAEKRWDSEAHPRACGENWCMQHAGELLPGSSPRMRGKLRYFPTRTSVRGLIPAHAGKTTQRSLDSASRRAHPRACGENLRGEQAAGGVEGSSPRMRGKRFTLIQSLDIDGLIPAHAGKTCAVVS